MEMKMIYQILFLFKVFYIIFSETVCYFIFKDYTDFIDGITTRLSCVNILYVKLFQAIALNNKMIDDKINTRLIRFTDDAPWGYHDIRLDDFIQLTNDFGIALPDGYETPINSGMISLVFKGYIKENGISKPVIIKMKRNNIEYKLNIAIENLQFFMYILSFIPIIKKYQIDEVINKNINMIRHQTNFNEEINNLTRIKNNCKNLKYVKIPKVYEEVTTKYPDFIMMEYIDGMKINEIDEKDYEGFAKQVMKFGFVTSIVHGVTHGDLHAGNILFIKDDNDEKYKYKIGVIDFGIIFEIESTYKSVLFEIMTEMFEQPPEVTSIKLLGSGIIEPVDVFNNLPKEHYNNILNFTTEIMADTIHSSKKANQFQIYKFLSKFKEYLSKNEIYELGLKPSDNFVKTQLVLGMAHGVTLTLCRDNFMELADKVINELFHTNIISENII
jgi:predicted unusual protein kinase regulating ubiquinone biosynthesis (AarF/ABC1/UbiB family)